MGINEQITNSDFIKKLNAFGANNSNDKLADLLYSLNDAKFLSPVIINGNIVNGNIEKGTTLQFKTIQYSTGDNYYLAFTDWDELRKWSIENEKTFVLSFEDLKVLYNQAKGNVSGFVINPFSQNFIVNDYALDYFSKIYSRVKIDKEMEIKLQQITEMPSGIRKDLFRALKNNEDVVSVYLYEAVYEEEKTTNLFCIIKSKNKQNEGKSIISSVIRKYLKENQFLDIVDYAEKYTELIANTLPIYEK